MISEIESIAKTKILDLVDFLVGGENAKPFKKEEAQQIIRMVGETLIQNKLANLYQKKFNDNPFETTEVKIARLEKELDELKNPKQL